MQAEQLKPGDVLADGRVVTGEPVVRGSFVKVPTSDELRPLFPGRTEMVTLREMVTD